jgi:membrane associated rhomboid family serine protease
MPFNAVNLLHPKFKKMLKAAEIPFYFSLALIFVFVFSEFTAVDLSPLGIKPRETAGLVGIITSYFVHAGLEHLLSNIFSLLFLGTALFWFYPRTAPRVMFYAFFLTGFLVWLFARAHTTHVGASGLVYVAGGYLLFGGVFRRQYSAVIISAAIFLMTGGMLAGIIPQGGNISWEGHAAGFFAGIFLAFYFRNETEFEEQTPKKTDLTYLPYQRGYQNWEGKNYKYTFLPRKKKE